MLFSNFLCLFYLMVLINSHTISKSIANDEIIDEIVDSLNDLEYATEYNARHDRFHYKFRRLDKEETATTNKAKTTKYAKDKDRIHKVNEDTTEKLNKKATSTVLKAVHGIVTSGETDSGVANDIWRRLQVKLGKNLEKTTKKSRVAKKRKANRHQSNKNDQDETVASDSFVHFNDDKQKRKKHFFDIRKRELQQNVTTDLKDARRFEALQPLKTNESVGMKDNFKTYDPIFDDDDENITTLMDRLTTNTSDKPKVYSWNEKANVEQTFTPNTTPVVKQIHKVTQVLPTERSDTEYTGTAAIEALLNEIKVNAIKMIAEQSPGVSDIITNSVTETTFEADPLLQHDFGKPGLVDTLVSTVELEEENAPKSARQTSTEGGQSNVFVTISDADHNLQARSIKDKAYTIACDWEHKIECEIKGAYKKAKKKLLKQIQKEVTEVKTVTKKVLNDASCELKELAGKIKVKTKPPKQKTQCCKVESLASRPVAKKTTAVVKKLSHKAVMTTPTTRPHRAMSSSSLEKKLQRQYTFRNAAAATDFTLPSLEDDYAMLNLFEEVLAKTHEDNVMKMLTTQTPVSKRRSLKEKFKLSKRNLETIEDLALKDHIRKIREGEGIPDDDSAYGVDADRTSTSKTTTTKKPEDRLTAWSSTGSIRLASEDTSFEGLTNKISFNEYVNGYRHYLNFAKDPDDQKKFSARIRFQAHRHHKVDDIGKFILNKLPNMPKGDISKRSKPRFFDDSDAEDQDISTKSDDSWFKKHFYVFLDSGPQKKFHVTQTVTVKRPLATPRTKVDKRKDLSEEGVTDSDLNLPDPTVTPEASSETGTRVMTGNEVVDNVNEIDDMLRSLDSKHTTPAGFSNDTMPHSSPTYETYTHQQPSTKTHRIFNNMVAIKPQYLIGKILGRSGRENISETQIERTEVNVYRGKRDGHSGHAGVNEDHGKSAITDTKHNFEGEFKKKQATAKLHHRSVPTEEPKYNKNLGFVDMNLVAKPTTTIKLKADKKKGRISRFFDMLKFRKKKPKKKTRRELRKERCSPLQRLKNMFLKSKPPNYDVDYNIMSTELNSFKVVKYNKSPSLQEIYRQVPNITADERELLKQVPNVPGDENTTIRRADSVLKETAAGASTAKTLAPQESLDFKVHMKHFEHHNQPFSIELTEPAPNYVKPMKTPASEVTATPVTLDELLKAVNTMQKHVNYKNPYQARMNFKLNPAKSDNKPLAFTSAYRTPNEASFPTLDLVTYRVSDDTTNDDTPYHSDDVSTYRIPDIATYSVSEEATYNANEGNAFQPDVTYRTQPSYRTRPTYRTQPTCRSQPIYRTLATYRFLKLSSYRSPDVSTYRIPVEMSDRMPDAPKYSKLDASAYRTPVTLRTSDVTYQLPEISTYPTRNVATYHSNLASYSVPVLATFRTLCTGRTPTRSQRTTRSASPRTTVSRAIASRSTKKFTSTMRSPRTTRSTKSPPYKFPDLSALSKIELTKHKIPELTFYKPDVTYFPKTFKPEIITFGNSNVATIKFRPNFEDFTLKPETLTPRLHPYPKEYATSIRRDRNSLTIAKDRKITGGTVTKKWKHNNSSTAKTSLKTKYMPNYFDDLLNWHKDILSMDQITNSEYENFMKTISEDVTTTPDLKVLNEELTQLKSFLNTFEPVKYSQPAKEKLVKGSTTGKKKSGKIDRRQKAVRNKIGKELLKAYKSTDGDRGKIVVGRQSTTTQTSTTGDEKPMEFDTTFLAIDDTTRLISDAIRTKLPAFTPTKAKTKLGTSPKAKISTPPVQYFRPPLPMQTTDFDNFLKENHIDVQSVTSPFTEISEFEEDWSRNHMKSKLMSSSGTLSKPARKFDALENSVKPVIEKPFLGKAGIDKVFVDKPLVDKPVTDKPVGERPFTERQIRQKSHSDSKAPETTTVPQEEFFANDFFIYTSKASDRETEDEVEYLNELEKSLIEDRAYFPRPRRQNNNASVDSDTAKDKRKIGMFSRRNEVPNPLSKFGFDVTTTKEKPMQFDVTIIDFDEKHGFIGTTMLPGADLLSMYTPKTPTAKPFMITPKPLTTTEEPLPSIPDVYSIPDELGTPSDVLDAPDDPLDMPDDIPIAPSPYTTKPTITTKMNDLTPSATTFDPLDEPYLTTDHKIFTARKKINHIFPGNKLGRPMHNRLLYKSKVLNVPTFSKNAEPFKELKKEPFKSTKNYTYKESKDYTLKDLKKDPLKNSKVSNFKAPKKEHIKSYFDSKDHGFKDAKNYLDSKNYSYKGSKNNMEHKHSGFKQSKDSAFKQAKNHIKDLKEHGFVKLKSFPSKELKAFSDGRNHTTFIKPDEYTLIPHLPSDFASKLPKIKFEKQPKRLQISSHTYKYDVLYDDEKKHRGSGTTILQRAMHPFRNQKKTIDSDNANGSANTKMKGTENIRIVREAIAKRQAMETEDPVDEAFILALTNTMAVEDEITNTMASEIENPVATTSQPLEKLVHMRYQRWSEESLSLEDYEAKMKGSHRKFVPQHPHQLPKNITLIFPAKVKEKDGRKFLTTDDEVFIEPALNIASKILHQKQHPKPAENPMPAGNPITPSDYKNFIPDAPTTISHDKDSKHPPLTVNIPKHSPIYYNDMPLDITWTTDTTPSTQTTDTVYIIHSKAPDLSVISSKDQIFKTTDDNSNMNHLSDRTESEMTPNAPEFHENAVTSTEFDPEAQHKEMTSFFPFGVVKSELSDVLEADLGSQQNETLYGNILSDYDNVDVPDYGLKINSEPEPNLLSNKQYSDIVTKKANNQRVFNPKVESIEARQRYMETEALNFKTHTTPNRYGFTKKHKRDAGTEKVFTANDVAALEIIVDLLKETQDDSGGSNAVKLRSTPKGDQSLSTNSIQVHIAVPYTIDEKKRSAQPTLLRKVFAAKMSSPVDLEYQVKSYEVSEAPDRLVASEEDNLTPGMYLLVENNKSPKLHSGFALKPVKTNVIRDATSKEAFISTSTIKTTSSKSLPRVTLTKEFIQTLNEQLVKLYQNLNTTGVRKVRGAKHAKQNKTTRRLFLWDKIKDYFGHDRACTCRCKENQTMCTACAASDAVMTELLFEFENIARYMNDHCTEVQTYFWMNPTGGRKLRDLVRNIDKNLNDYYKRVKGKCQGRTCNTFQTYIDKREFTRPYKVPRNYIGQPMLDDFKKLADDVKHASDLRLRSNKRFKEAAQSLIKTADICLHGKSKREVLGDSKLQKSVYSLDNINVNIICSKDCSTPCVSTTCPYQTEPNVIASIMDYNEDESTSKTSAFRRLFKKPKNKKDKHKPKRGIDQMKSLIADPGGAFWNDYLKKFEDGVTVTPTNITEKDALIQLRVLQMDHDNTAFVKPYVTATLVKVSPAITHPTPKGTMLLRVKNKHVKTRSDDTTSAISGMSESLSHNMNELMKLFDSLPDVQEVKDYTVTSEMTTTQKKDKKKKPTDKKKTTTATTHTSTTVTTTIKTKATTKDKKKGKTTKTTELHFKDKDKVMQPLALPKFNDTKNIAKENFDMLSKPEQLLDGQTLDDLSSLEQTLKKSTPNTTTKKSTHKTTTKMGLLDRIRSLLTGDPNLSFEPTTPVTNIPEKRDARSPMIVINESGINVKSEPTTVTNPTIFIIEELAENDFKESEAALLDKDDLLVSVLEYEQKNINSELEKYKKKSFHNRTSSEDDMNDFFIVENNKYLFTTAKPPTKPDKMIEGAVGDYPSLLPGLLKKKTTTTKPKTNKKTLLKLLKNLKLRSSSSSNSKADKQELRVGQSSREGRPRQRAISDRWILGESISTLLARDPETTSSPTTTTRTTRTTPWALPLAEVETETFATSETTQEYKTTPTTTSATRSHSTSNSKATTKPPTTKHTTTTKPTTTRTTTTTQSRTTHKSTTTTKPKSLTTTKTAPKLTATIKLDQDINTPTVTKTLATGQRIRSPNSVKEACEPSTELCICDLGATSRRIIEVRRTLPRRDFEQYAKNISCYRYRKPPNVFIVAPWRKKVRRKNSVLPTDRVETTHRTTKKRKWDWIRSKRSLLSFVDDSEENFGEGMTREELFREKRYPYEADDDVDDDDETLGDDEEIASEENSSLYDPHFDFKTGFSLLEVTNVELDDDYFERLYKGEDNVYRKRKKRRRKRTAGDMKELTNSMKDLPPLKPAPNEIYIMVGETTTIECSPPIARFRDRRPRFVWWTDRTAMLEYDNVVIRDNAVILNDVQPANAGNYTCYEDDKVRRSVKVSVVELPQFKVVFIPMYDTKDGCTYDDLRALQQLGAEMAEHSFMDSREAVIVDEPICLEDKDDASVHFRFVCVLTSLSPWRALRCGAQCRRDLHCALALLAAGNTRALQAVPVVVSKNGVNKTLTPSHNNNKKLIVTHTLRKKDLLGRNEYHQLAASMSPGNLDIVVACPAGYYLMSKQKICVVCPANTYSLSGENTCYSCGTGTVSEPGSSRCRLTLRHLRRYSSWWCFGCGGVGAVGALVALGGGCVVCAACALLAHVTSRSVRAHSRAHAHTLSAHAARTESRWTWSRLRVSQSAAAKHCSSTSAAGAVGGAAGGGGAGAGAAKGRTVSPSAVILARFFRVSQSSSRATAADSQETKFEQWKEKNIPPPLPPVDFDTT